MKSHRPAFDASTKWGATRTDTQYAWQRASISKHRKFYKKANLLREYRRKHGGRASTLVEGDPSERDTGALDGDAETETGGSRGTTDSGSAIIGDGGGDRHESAEDRRQTGQKKKKRKGAAAEVPPGSWTCGACGNMNWPSRTHCNTKTCGLARDDAEAQGGVGGGSGDGNGAGDLDAVDERQTTAGDQQSRGRKRKRPAGSGVAVDDEERTSGSARRRTSKPSKKPQPFSKETKKAKLAKAKADADAAEREEKARAKDGSIKQRKKVNQTFAQRDRRGRPLIRNTISRILEKLS